MSIWDLRMAIEQNMPWWTVLIPALCVLGAYGLYEAIATIKRK